MLICRQRFVRSEYQIIEQDKRTGADHRHGAAKNCSKSHGHEQPGHGQAGTGRDARYYRQEQGGSAHILHERGDETHCGRNDGDDAFFRRATDLEDEGRHLAHDACLVQPGTNDHDRYDGHDGIGGETVEKMFVVHQPLLESHQWRKQGCQPQQHHHRGGGNIHAHYFEDKKIDGQNQYGADPGNFYRRYGKRQKDGKSGERHGADDLFFRNDAGCAYGLFFVCEFVHLCSRRYENVFARTSRPAHACMFAARTGKCGAVATLKLDKIDSGLKDDVLQVVRRAISWFTDSLEWSEVRIRVHPCSLFFLVIASASMFSSGDKHRQRNTQPGASIPHLCNAEQCHRLFLN